MQRICVFCGSSAGANPRYAQAAQELGAALARRGIGVVYGGTTIGLMGQVAQAALDAGGQATGVVPDFLTRKEIAHDGLTALHVVPSLHERKQLMERLSDAFIAIPGGMGTLDELSEMLTWTQLGLHHKPVGVLNVNGFFDRMLEFMDHMVREGFLRPGHRNLLHVADTTEGLLAMFEAAQSAAG